MYYELKAQRAQRRKVLINITPLIDVLFLLLIFFLVSSTFLEQPSVTIELPEAKTAEAQEIEPHVVLIDREGAMFINDTPIKGETLLSRLVRIKENDPDASLVLKADDSAPYGKIIQVIDAVRECGLKKIVALTRLQEE